MMNAGELQASVIRPKWREENGIIYFSVTSDGATGEEWITRLESKGFRVSGYAKIILRSKDFKPTSGITTEITVIKGVLFEDNIRITKRVRAYVKKHQLFDPNAELACLIREKFSDKEIEAMGLWWLDLGSLSVARSVGGSWLFVPSPPSDSECYHDRGFAFVSSQVGS